MKQSRFDSIAAAGVVLMMLALPATLSFGAEDGKRSEWVREFEERKARPAQLAAELESARGKYMRGHSARSLRGDTKTDLVDEITRLEKELAQAEQGLQDFPEEARRAGALPGWFRDDDPAAAAPNEARARPRRSRSGRSESLSQRAAQARQMQSGPAEAAAPEPSDLREDAPPPRRSLSSRRAEERESRRLSR